MRLPRIPLASRCTFISELFERAADAGSALSRESRLPPALADCYQNLRPSSDAAQAARGLRPLTSYNFAHTLAMRASWVPETRYVWPQ